MMNKERAIKENVCSESPLASGVEQPGERTQGEGFLIWAHFLFELQYDRDTGNQEPDRKGKGGITRKWGRWN